MYLFRNGDNRKGQGDLKSRSMKPSIDDIPIHPLTFGQAIETLAAWASESRLRYVSTCTAYTLMKGLEDPRVYDALANADMRTADGVPLVWRQRLAGHKHAERVYGPDLMLALLKRTAGDAALSHFFYGGLPGVPERLGAVIKAQITNVQIAGTFSPEVSEVSETIDSSVADMLNESGAAVIWVGLGSPKQDVWMRLYRPVLKAPLLIGVGAAFDFISGSKRQAPAWIRSSGLEWLFRLYQEPGRLFRRYAVYNTTFLVAAVRSYLRR